MSGLKFGVVNDTTQPTGKWGKFGLNQDLRVTGFEFKNGGTWQAIKTIISTEEKDFWQMMFIPTGDLYYNRVKISPGHAEYDKALQKQMDETMKTFLQTLFALGVTEAQIEEAYRKAGNITSIEQWYNTVMTTLPTNYKEVSVDVFLQWQSKPSKGQDKTYLEIPSNGDLWKGKIITAHVDGDFKELRDNGHLIYMDSMKKEVHPIGRDSKFMESKNATKFEEGNEAPEPENNLEEQKDDLPF